MIKKILFLSLCLFAINSSLAQEIIELPYEQTSETTWDSDEKNYFSKVWDTPVVTNVSIPTMEVFRPKNPNGTAVIIAPGGGLYALSIKSEGTDVAKWLNQKGITAFVLKYRLVPTKEDGTQELSDDGLTNPVRIAERVAPVMPLSIADALSAVSYVRENASTFKIVTDKIGFMGFSAGGAVTMGVAYNYSEKNRPDFLVPVYPWTSVYPVQKVPQNAPPMLVVCATDDPLDLAIGSIELYSSWHNSKKSVALHMFSKGGHGFGMRKQGLPSDHWIERFHEWAIAESLILTTDKN